MALKFLQFLGQILNWILTTPLGATLLASILGFFMTLLAFFTDALSQYAPLSYGLVFLSVSFSALLLGLFAGFIWTQISQRILTKRETYLEYKIENRRVNLVKKSNIYKEPTCELVDQPEMRLVTQQTHMNRQQRRAANSGQQNVNDHVGPSIVIPQNLSLKIFVPFQIPLAPQSFHVRIESIVGVCPTRESSNIDERWSNLVLSNIPDNCSFRIRFN